jgi:peptide/nickel transport system substrate-binding protein
MTTRYIKANLIYGLVIFATVLLAACGTGAPPTPEPTTTTALEATPPSSSSVTQAPQATTASTSVPTPAPQPTSPGTEGPKSAKDKAIAVIGSEPEKLFFMATADAHTTQVTEQMDYYIGHLDKNTLQVTPSHMIVSWEQTGPAEWIYKLRPGVTFHDGEPWNAEAWNTYAEFAGVTDFGVGAYAHTGPYSVEPVDELTARIKCGEPCPLFDRGLNVSQTQSPKQLREQEFSNITIGAGAGPFKLERWDRGSKVVLTAFEGYVPAPESPEHAGPYLKELEFQWRTETTVRAAMIETGEADWAFLLGIEDTERLGQDQFITGGTAEIAQFRIDTIWDPWLRELDMRRAIVHAINCQDIVDSIYGGTTTCRGNSGAPGVLGITEENIKPYEFNPDLSRQLLEQIGYICDLPNSRQGCEAKIIITSRTARIEKNEELVESMVSFMKDVGINAEANFVETSIRTAMDLCGIGKEGAGGTQVGWQGATAATPPTCEGGVGVGQILEGIGFGYETLDYAKFVSRHMLCESARSTVCVPEKEEEWSRARSLAGEERRKALEEIANWERENVYIIPMFDLFAIYGVNPKLRGFEEPRFDKHTFAGLWRFEE